MPPLLLPHLPPQFQSTDLSLFLAVFPDENTAYRIYDLATSLRSYHRLTGRVRPLSHLHISLNYIGDQSKVTDNTIQAVGEACETVTTGESGVEVTFDRVMSFKTRAQSCPLVLSGDAAENTALKHLQHRLAQELGLRLPDPGKKQKFVPHLTLLYDKQLLPETRVEPVRLTVAEITLVLSEVGATRYHILGKWKLGA